MKSLEENNREALKAWHAMVVPRQRNGIACPECGHELVDTTHGVALACDPPRYEIACESCGSRRHR